MGDVDIDIKLSIETGVLKPVPVILQELQELCAKMHEAQEMCVFVLQRLTAAAFAVLQLRAKLPDKLMNDSLQVLYGYHRFLERFAGKKNPILRLALHASVAREIMAFHRQIDDLLRKLRLAQQKPGENLHDWERRFDAAREKQRLEFGKMSEETNFLAAAVADPRVQVEVAVLMMNESKQLTDSHFRPEINITKRAFDLIKGLPDVQVPVLPVWFIALHEISCDASPLREGWYGPEHRGRYKGSPVLLKFVQLRTKHDREAFKKTVASWFHASHPNIVRLVGACHVGTPFFLCEYAENGTLYDFLKNSHEGRFRTWTTLYEASSGLLHLHDRAMIHNNLKCSSIVIAADGTAKLTDLAINSSVAHVDLEVPGSDDSRAPDRVESSRNAFFESDIYSLGMCILEATVLNSPGFSATLGSPSFCDFSEDQCSPEQQRVCLTACSFMYSLGKRIADTVALMSPWNDASGERPSDRETNEVNFPPKPRSMNAELWTLVNEMCSMNPREQSQLPAVVARLQHLAEVESKMSVHRATDLTRAVRHSQVDVVRFLIEHGVPIDKIGESGENSDDGWDSEDSEGSEDSDSDASPLSLAVCGKSIEMVKILVELGAAVDVEDDEGRTPLSRAIEARNMDIARYLIQSGASVGKSSSYRPSPLSQAVFIGDVDFAKFLIEYGAPIEKSTGWWESPMYLAAKDGHVDMLELLFAMGATHDEDAYHGKTPLHSASGRGHSAVIRTLVKYDASVNVQSPNRLTPIFFAAKRGRLDAARTLVELGATVNSANDVGRTPLFAAAESGRAELVPFLVEHGARVDQHDDKGQTPLIRAAKFGFLNIVKELVQLQASIDVADKKGQTPILTASKHDHVEIVEYLVRQGADTSQRSEDGKSLLHVAAEKSSTGVLEYLLGDHVFANNEGIDDQDPPSGSTDLSRLAKSTLSRIPVDQIDGYGRTPLFHAIEARSMEVVSLLVKYGAAIDHSDKCGETPLFCALQIPFEEAVFFLVKHGASVNHKNKIGESPLFSAVLQVGVEVIRYLVEHGADVNAEDAHGRTLMFFAAGSFNIDTIKFLADSGAAVDKKDADGETALLATVKGFKDYGEMFSMDSHIFLEPVEVLLDLGASIGEKDLNGLTPLLIAVRDDLADLVALLVRHGAAVDDKDSSSWTPLHHAAQLGSVASAKVLIEGGASIEEDDTNGRTPLFVAAESDKEEIIKYLVDRGAFVDGVDVNGRTLLFPLAKNGLSDAGELLLSRGVPLDAKDESDQTALFPAIKHGHLKFAKLLVRKGAQVDAKNIAGRTPLHIAAQFGHLDILSFLLSSSASIDEADVDLRTPLFLSAKHGHVETMRTLIQHGASVSVRDVDGKTLLFGAAGNGCLEAAKFLIREGLSIHEKDVQGRSPVFCAALNGHFGIAKLLVEHGASLEDQDEKGKTVLVVAIEEKRQEAVKFLLDNGVSIHKQDVHRKTPMAAAVQSCDGDIVQLLIQRGALVDQQSSGGRTPLFYAVAEGSMDIAKLLITHGASLAAVDANRNTPLHATAAENQQAIAELLLAENAALDHVNLRQETPLLVAGRYGHFDLVKLLVESGASVNVRAGDGETILTSASRFGYLGFVQFLINSSRENDPTAQREEAPLMLSTLTKMQQLCGATDEFQQMCETAVKRLIDTWQQVLAQNSVEDETWVMFAKIVFRFCRFLVNWDRKSPSSRVLASRATRKLVRKVHEEIDFFLATKIKSGAAGWEEGYKTELQHQRGAFQAILISPEKSTTTSHGDSRESGLLLQYELQEHGADYEASDLQLLKTLQAQLPRGFAEPVPVWFVSRDDVDFEERHKAEGEEYLGITKYLGQWTHSKATISTSQASEVHFRQMADRWHESSHPHVIKFFGACHIGNPRFFVYEDLSAGTLREYLGKPGNRRLTWQKLREAALGLQYLHDRDLVHGELRCDILVVGSDLKAKIAGFGETALRLNSKARVWESPELRTRDNISLAHDIYAFGMCILEILTDTCTTEEQEIYFTAIDRDWTPALPTGMNSTHWKLIKMMCRRDPAKRTSIRYVVNELYKFASEDKSGEGERSAQPRGEWGDGRGQDLDIARAKRDALPEVAQHILARLDDVYVKLKAMRKSTSDLATDKFDGIVSRFYSFYVKTRIAEDSTKHVARSRQVSEENSVLHVELDRLLAMLNVAITDSSVHQWKHLCPKDVGGDDESSLETEFISSVANRNANSVTLVVFECDARHPNYAAPDSQPGYGPPSTPSWLIRYSDIHFDQKQSIAAGSFGQVCHGMWLDSPVVIKYMGYEDDPSTVSNCLLLHEIRIWYPLNHPHVIRLYGASHIGKRYFACEFASNGTLSEYLKRGNNRDLAWRKLYEAALGLKYVHDHGIVHNDLKCDNILIGAGGTAKLSDFGLSSIPDVAEIMVAKSKMGAVNWKSPEYLDGGRPTFMSDIYSFAMCILEAVTGETPWGNLLPVSVKFHVRNGRIPDKPEGISNKEWRLIQEMTTTDPAKRPRISYVVEKLQEFVDDTPAP